MIKHPSRSVVILLIIANVATAYNELTNVDTDPISIMMVVISIVVGFILVVNEIVERIKDNKDSQEYRKEQQVVSNIPGTIEGYLAGLLLKFKKEENYFVKLAGQTEIPSRFVSIEGENHTWRDLSVAAHVYDGRFMLLGEPGAGKSTALRRLITEHIHQYQTDQYIQGRLPLWINLGVSGNPVKVEELLQMWWDEQHSLPSSYKPHLQQNHLALYLDGLNEMPEEGSNRVERAKRLRQFIEQHPDLPVIITCRTHDYRDEPDMEMGLPKVFVQPLDNERIQEFIRKRGDITLWERMKQNQALRRMAENPYNLVMLIEVHQAGRLPNTMQQLYDMYVQTTYHEYTEKREKAGEIPLLHHKSWEELRDKLRWLAYKMIADGKGTSAPLKWVQDLIGRYALRDGVNLNVLVVDGEKELYVKFYHQSLHTYFAIKLLNDALRRQRGVERFRDPVQLIQQIGYLGDAGILALNILIKILEDNNHGRNQQQLRLVTATALGEIGDSKALNPLVNIIKSSKESLLLKVRSITALGRLSDKRAINPLLECLNDPVAVIRAEAVKALSTLGNYIGDHQHILKPISNLIRDNDRDVRLIVVQTLQIFKEKTAADSLVAALNDSDPLVRSEAEKGLSNMGHLGVAALLLGTRQKNGRIQAIYERLYALLSPSEAAEALIPGLRESAPHIHQHAENKLRTIGLPAVEPLMSAIQQYIDDEDFRQSGGAVLRDIGEPAVETLITALRSSQENMRWIAARALREIESKQSVSALIQAVKDPYFNVKRTAIEALGRIGDPRAIRILLEARLDTSSGNDLLGSSVGNKRVSDYANEALKKFPKQQVQEIHKQMQEEV